MRAGLIAERLTASWSRRGPLNWMLAPVSLLYLAMLQIRRKAYQWRAVKSERVNPMVLVVGNVVAGGAGKTPTTIALVRHLLAHQWKVGVISRGYGRSSRSTSIVNNDSPPSEVGDEPLLIHTATAAPTAVAPRRIDAANALLKAHPELQILVCDDGLQHYALYRDLEVCVFDDRGTGNGWVLPAGPLREPWPGKSISAVGQSTEGPLVLNTAVSPPQSADGNIRRTGLRGFTAHRSLAALAVNQAGQSFTLSELAASGTPVSALAGIARPEQFFDMLRQAGIRLTSTLALPDHADFNVLSLDIPAGHTLLCTEKDARKLWPKHPQALAVGLQLDIEPAFFTALDARIQSAMQAKLSSTYGHPTS